MSKQRVPFAHPLVLGAYAVALVLVAVAIASVTTTEALTPNGRLHGTVNNFSCDPGYSLRSYHYDCRCSNNATWYACVR